MNTESHIGDDIKQRKTAKVLADAPWKPNLNNSEQEELIRDLLELAACAPYHYKSAAKYHTSGLESPLPFRAYTLTSKACRKLAEQLLSMNPPPGKI
ncbi:MAG: hypothetical protein VXY91_01920, partial [Bacteroidota bacterium]|nr:hypothetical protein [Bacteroidota bacterium]